MQSVGKIMRGKNGLGVCTYEGSRSTGNKREREQRYVGSAEAGEKKRR